MNDMKLLSASIIIISFVWIVHAQYMIILKNGELLVLLNNVKPKQIRGLKCIRINSICFDEYHYKNLLIHMIRNKNKGVKYYLLKTKGLSETLFDHDGIYFFEIDCSRIKMQIEVEYRNGKFNVLSEEYNSYPEYYRWEHYKNTF